MKNRFGVLFASCLVSSVVSVAFAQGGGTSADPFPSFSHFSCRLTAGILGSRETLELDLRDGRKPTQAEIRIGGLSFRASGEYQKSGQVMVGPSVHGQWVTAFASWELLKGKAGKFQFLGKDGATATSTYQCIPFEGFRG